MRATMTYDGLWRYVIIVRILSHEANGSHSVGDQAEEANVPAAPRVQSAAGELVRGTGLQLAAELPLHSAPHTRLHRGPHEHPNGPP